LVTSNNFFRRDGLKYKNRERESYPQQRMKKIGSQIGEEKFGCGRKKRFRAELGRLSTKAMDNLWING
jgi:hypothetical protein